MKKMITKVISLFIWGAVLLWLISYSYSASISEDLSSLGLEHQVKNVLWENVKKENFNKFSTIYSSSGSLYVIKETDDAYIVRLEWKGEYLLDIAYSVKKIIIIGSIYETIMDSAGVVYVRNTSKRGMISSFNTELKVNFFDVDITDVKTRAYLYPHMYLSFSINKLRGKTLDSLRLSQLRNLTSFNQDYNDIISWAKTFWLKDTSFLKKSLGYLVKDQKNKLISFYKEISAPQSKDISKKYIEKYSYLFYNNRKKVIYLKNEVLMSLINLMRNKKMDMHMLNGILDNIEELKSLSEEEYILLKKQIAQYYLISLPYYGDWFRTLNKNFYYLLDKIENKSGVSHQFLLQRDFDIFNFRGGTNIYESIHKNHKKTIRKINGTWEYDYYLLFLKHVILSGLQSEKLISKDITILMNLLKEYSTSFNKRDDELSLITVIIENEEILESLKELLLVQYFSWRDKKRLLIKGNKTFWELGLLKGIIKNMYSLYEDWKQKYFDQDVSNEKYINIIENYSSLDQDFKEYMDAFDNYLLYKNNYDSMNISKIQIYPWEVKEKKLSKWDFLKYIEQFSGIDKESVQVYVDGDAYVVENIRIFQRGRSETFSFVIFPNRWHLLTDITTKWKGEKVETIEDRFYFSLKENEFVLDNVEKKSTKGDKNNNFKNFFSNKFFYTRKKGADWYVDRQIVKAEDPVIVTLKQVVLLGKSGEFSTIRDFFRVEYQNLDVKGGAENAEDINIYIHDASIELVAKNSGKQTIMRSGFNSDYVLRWGDHYFKNIRLSPSRLVSWRDIPLLWWADLQIIWNIHMQDFRERMTHILSSIDEIQREYQSYLQVGSQEASVITYNPVSWELNFH